MDPYGWSRFLRRPWFNWFYSLARPSGRPRTGLAPSPVAAASRLTKFNSQIYLIPVMHTGNWSVRVRIGSWSTAHRGGVRVTKCCCRRVLRGVFVLRPPCRLAVASASSHRRREAPPAGATHQPRCPQRARVASRRVHARRLKSPVTDSTLNGAPQLRGKRDSPARGPRHPRRVV